MQYNTGMETITYHVRDIESNERRILERLIGRQLHANQQIIIRVVTVGSPSTEETNELGAPGTLPDWCNVYESLTDKQLVRIEEAILQRTGPSFDVPSLHDPGER